jgi:3D (Asp-Asp-Asp) domain-containing protein
MDIYIQSESKEDLKKLILALVLGLLAVGYVGPQIVQSQTNDQQEQINEQINLSNSQTSTFPKAKQREELRSYQVVATAYSSEIAQTDNSPCIPSQVSFNLCEYYKKYGVANTIAANFLPLGAKVRFPEIYENKVFTVRDRMNSRYNGTTRVDFWKSNKKTATNFGVKSLKMEVIEY